MSSRDSAARTLKGYFRQALQASGRQWTSENDADIDGAVDALITAAVQEAKEAQPVQFDSKQFFADVARQAQQPAEDATQEEKDWDDPVQVDAAHEAARQLAIQAIEENATTRATQPDGDLVCPMCGKRGAMGTASRDKSQPGHYMHCPACHWWWRHERDGEALCPACYASNYLIHTDGGPDDLAMCLACGHTARYGDFHLKWHEVTGTPQKKEKDGAGTVVYCIKCLRALEELNAVAYGDAYYCPACASKAWRNDAQAMDSLSRDLQLKVAELRRVPVSAITYLMADIAPVDEHDKLKEIQSRAAVTAWLEALEEEEDGTQEEEDSAYHDPMDVHESPSTTPYYHERED